jgi:hypothetical protein
MINQQCQTMFKGIFESVLGIGFQSIFCLRMHQNNIYF